MGLQSKTNNKQVKIHHTKRGVLSADPEQILRSKNAKRQIRALKDSNLLEEIRGRQSDK